MAVRKNNSEYRILIADDDPEVTKLMWMILDMEGYSIDSAYSGAEALKKLDEWEPHLVLLDVNMPELSGLDTIIEVRKRADYVPVIFVSGNSETEDVIKGLSAGGDDYICKPFNPHELIARVKTQLRIKDLTDQLGEANKKLQALIEIDDLTGLYNMRNAYQKIDLEISRCKRFKKGIGAIMLDMDKFKRVNDDHDHLFGSFVLKEVGGIIRDSIRDVDMGTRYGGDEFMIILSATTYEGAQAFCERLRKKIESYKFDNGDHQMDLTTSIGLAVGYPDQYDLSSKSLLQWADKALYESKETGRNKVGSVELTPEVYASDIKTAA